MQMTSVSRVRISDILLKCSQAEVKMTETVLVIGSNEFGEFSRLRQERNLPEFQVVCL